VVAAGPRLLLRCYALLPWCLRASADSFLIVGLSPSVSTMAASAARRRSPSAGRMFPSRSRPRDRLISLVSTGGRASAGARRNRSSSVGTCGAADARSTSSAQATLFDRSQYNDVTAALIRSSRRPFWYRMLRASSAHASATSGSRACSSARMAWREIALDLWPPRRAPLVVSVDLRSVHLSSG
jgi:hypothetical protein